MKNKRLFFTQSFNKEKLILSIKFYKINLKKKYRNLEPIKNLFLFIKIEYSALNIIYSN